MKPRLIQISFLLIFILSAEIYSGDNECRYLTGYIKNVNDNHITLTNNLVWRADRHVSAISMLPITIVLKNDRTEGYLYIKNEKIYVTLMQKSANGNYMPAMNERLSSYNIGTLTEIKKIDAKKGTILLANGDAWSTKSEEDNVELGNWSTGSEVIVTKNGNSVRVTNVVNSGYISVSSKSELASDKRTD